MVEHYLRVAMVVAITTCALVLVNGAPGQALPRDLQSWELQFTISGTIRGLDEQLTLNQAGELTAGHSTGGSQVAGHASPELLAKVKAWLRVARPAKPEDKPAIPDALLLTAVLTSAGRRYPLDVPIDLYQPLQAAFNTVFKQALVGSWRQSAWKLCVPAKQLQASDTDPPIDDLSFRPDGTFTVTWRGGAHTGNSPHVFVPAYKGHYEADGASGYLSMKYDRPNSNYDGTIVIPRDFSGDGYFTITANQLTLRNIWLGTRQAKQKPDICELTFTRAARTPQTTRH